MEVYVSFNNCHFFFGDGNEFGNVFPNDDTPENDSVPARVTFEIKGENADDDGEEEDEDDDLKAKPLKSNDLRKIFGFLMGKHEVCVL